MQIGPAFTMTLPMLVGSGMALVSNRMLGMSGTSFMYTGLVTAGCSGALGVFWALNNIRYSEKQRKKEEEHRLTKKDTLGNLRFVETYLMFQHDR